MGARDRKCRRAVFLDYRHFTFFFFFTYRRLYHGLLPSRVLSSPSISVHNSVRRGYFYSDCSLAACGTGRGGGGGNLFPGGKSFVVRITGLRVEKSVAQRVVQASTRHIPSRGRLARHRKRFWPKTAPRIPTSSAPVIGPDRENKDSHGHNRGSTSGYGPVPYSYEHSATPAPPIYPALYPTSLYSTYSYRGTVSNFRSIILKNKRTGWLKRLLFRSR